MLHLGVWSAAFELLDSQEFAEGEVAGEVEVVVVVGACLRVESIFRFLEVDVLFRGRRSRGRCD